MFLRTPNFPLFDAFIIELDRAKKFAILWILQVTTSRMHGGSTMGYQKIGEIITILKDELREDPPRKKSKVARQTTSTPLVRVRCLLVVPKDEPQSQNLWQWQFPKGWSQNRKRNDHSGEVYCLEVPLAVCSTIINNVSSSFEHIASRCSECMFPILLSLRKLCVISASGLRYSPPTVVVNFFRRLLFPDSDSSISSCLHVYVVIDYYYNYQTTSARIQKAGSRASISRPVDFC